MSTRRRVSRVPLSLTAILVFAACAGCCKDKPGGKSSSKPAPSTKPAVSYELASSSSRHLLTDRYPRTDLRLELLVRYTAPGTVVDTVGINTAKAGSFAVMILPSGQVRAQVFDPGRSSTGKLSNGWHVLDSPGPIRKNVSTPVTLELWKGTIALWVDNKLVSRLQLATPLSGEPVYLGDFPGDDGLAPRYNAHTAMVGNVSLFYFGRLDPKVYAADRRGSP